MACLDLKTLARLATLSLALGVSGAALADPCKAIPDNGPLPAYLRPGATFTGPAAHVGDGDSLCVALGPSPGRWVEVRLADFYAPELHTPEGPAAKRALDRLTAGQTLTCVAGHRSYDRVVAVCRVGQVSLGDLMRQAGIAEGGRGRRPNDQAAR